MVDEYSPNMTVALVIHAVCISEYAKHEIDTWNHQHCEDVVATIVCDDPSSFCNKAICQNTIVD